MTRPAVGTLLAALSIALVGTVAPASAAQAAPPTVTLVSANGSGCPNASATAGPLSGGSSFTVDFGGYFVYSGEDGTVTDTRLNCQFALQITRPAGWTYAVQSAEFSGFTLLNAGVRAAQFTHYYFQGGATVTRSHTYTGPYAETWDTVDEFDADEAVFAPCDAERLLNINTELRITSQPADADLSGIFLDPSFNVRLTWSRCG